MSKHEYISRNLIIINYLKRGQALWADILHHLETQSEISGYNYVISQRTFQRDIAAIRSLWNYDIQNNKATGYYFIADSEEEQNENNHLLDSFNLFNALSLSHNYTQHIQFESRIPKGTEHIYGLLHAIKNKLVIEITYHKFYEDDAEKVIVHPYLIKQFKGRWYLLCLKAEINQLRTYGLDRILRIDIKKKKFTLAKGLDLNNYFTHCFGIITPNEGKPQKIVFAFNKEQANYIKNYPLHQSQKIVKETSKETQFEITVFIIYDLIMELQSYGKEITILSPKNILKNH